jgi:hypothetical protein
MHRTKQPTPSGISEETVARLYPEARARGIVVPQTLSRLDWPLAIARLKPLTNLETKFRWERMRWAIWRARQAGIPLDSLNGEIDPLLITHSFCNPSRVLDGISQHTVDFGLTAKDLSEMVTWTVLLKVFNDWPAFEMLLRLAGGTFVVTDLDAEYLWRELNQARDRGELARPGDRLTWWAVKGTRRCFFSAVQALKDGIADRIADCSDLYAVADLLRACPGIGDFHASQITIDLAYSDFLKGRLEDFIWAGPGACQGVGLWFEPRSWSWAAVNDALRLLTIHQEACYMLVNKEPALRLQGRLAFMQDVQNHACETQKYFLRPDNLRVYRGSGSRQDPPLLPRWW